MSLRILLVCLGNICRTPRRGHPAAKARASGLDWEIASAGTNGYHTGEAPITCPKSGPPSRLDISHQRPGHSQPLISTF